MDVWAACKDRISLETICHELIRVVESQEQVATNYLVDSIEEQGIIENLLEQSKPLLPENNRQLHYLLASPFRYPPLPHGSRFSTRYEPSLYYGAHQKTTAFAETAYYRFLFWLGMSEAPASGKFTTQHTVFGAKYNSTHGLKLQKHPFSDYTDTISNPASYVQSQQIGRHMRELGIQVFEFVSARDTDRGINAALFTPAALFSSQPSFQEQWLCETNAARVSFFTYSDGQVYKYPLQTFFVDGEFPQISS